ncbi:MAG: PH domain-containing protein [Erythrobacter sp.]|nr:MAG: PH domain-containing protein [Erythrobacter sp.]
MGMMSGGITEYEHEPVRGLPGDLPAGEHIVWQGSPDWRTFLRSALHSRWIVGYFAVLGIWGLASGSMFAIGASVAACALTLGLLAAFAVAVEKTTVYTLTNRRIVLRIGVALNKCINLPLKLIGSAELRRLALGHGDIALLPIGKHGLGYAVLWPHARPWKLSQVQPMLRAVPEAAKVASLLAEACASLVPVDQVQPERQERPAFRPALVPVRMEEAAA